MTVRDYLGDSLGIGPTIIGILVTIAAAQFLVLMNRVQR